MKIANKKTIIYGTGGLARMLLEEARRYQSFEPVAFVADSEYLNSDVLDGLPVVGFEKLNNLYPPEKYDMIVAFGFGRMRDRAKLYEKAKQTGYTLVNYISPGAFLESRICIKGDNNIILSGARLGFGGSMGSDNVIRQNVYIGHEFVIGSHNIISVGCVFGGRSVVHDLSYFGLSMVGSSYREYGDECLVGMGSVVTKDIDAYAKAYGNPARVVSYHKEEGVCINFK